MQTDAVYPEIVAANGAQQSSPKSSSQMQKSERTKTQKFISKVAQAPVKNEKASTTQQGLLTINKLQSNIPSGLPQQLTRGGSQTMPKLKGLKPVGTIKPKETKTSLAQPPMQTVEVNSQEESEELDFTEFGLEKKVPDHLRTENSHISAKRFTVPVANAEPKT